MFLPSPVRDQVTILDNHLASDSNEQAISDHYIFDLETFSGISSTHEISREVQELYCEIIKVLFPKH